MSVEWIEPVIDRTVNDVVEAKRQIELWKNEYLKGNSMVTYELKGCFNVSDINRIEGNIKFLAETLSSLSYPVGVSTKSWDKLGVPTKADIDRTLNNINNLIRGFYQREVTDLPSVISTHSDLNSVEENLKGIKDMLDDMISSFRMSGTFQSGTRNILPIRR